MAHMGSVIFLYIRQSCPTFVASLFLNRVENYWSVNLLKVLTYKKNKRLTNLILNRQLSVFTRLMQGIFFNFKIFFYEKRYSKIF